MYVSNKYAGNVESLISKGGGRKILCAYVKQHTLQGTLLFYNILT